MMKIPARAEFIFDGKRIAGRYALSGVESKYGTFLPDSILPEIPASGEATLMVAGIAYRILFETCSAPPVHYHVTFPVDKA